MDAIIPRTEIPVSLDPAGQEVVLLGALLGSQITDDVFVSYTTLLLGLLFAKLDHEQVDGGRTNGGLAWHTAAVQTLNIEGILSDKTGLSRRMAEDNATAVRSKQMTSWPTGRPLVSVSAINVLRQAEDVAHENRGPEAVVTPADIMASFLYTIPPAHADQAVRWGMTEAAIQKIGTLLPGLENAKGAERTERAESTEQQAAELVGYDLSASTILKFAFGLSGRRRNGRHALLASETLLVAIAETVPLLPQMGAAEAAVLRGMLHAGDPDSNYTNRRNTLFDMTTDPRVAVTNAGTEWPPLSQNAQAILADARACALRMSRSEITSPRHLLAALISRPDGTDRASVSANWLEQSGVATDTLRAALNRVIHDRHPSDDHAAWRGLLIGRDLSVVTTARPDTIPDDPRAADTLDLRRYADAIGALISAIDQKPPLSIAVFGPWGSGKSFFMAMIRAAVKDFANAGADAFKAKKATPFLRRVVQIEFNAWHYAEGNLWASLVHAILVGLQQELAPQASHSVFQDVLDRLHLHEAAKLEAEAKLRDAEQRLAETRAALGKAEEEATTRRDRESNIPSALDIVQAVQDEALESLRPPGNEAGAPAWIASVGDSVTKAAAYLGRPELATQVAKLQRAANDEGGAAAALQVKVADIRDLLDETKVSVTGGLSVLGWLANARVEPGDLRALLLKGAGVLVGLVIVALLLGHWGADIAAAVSAMAAFVVPLVGALTVAIGWARRHLAHATRAFTMLGSIRERVETRQAQRLAARDADLQAARSATADAEGEAARRQAQVEAARVAVEKAKEELKAATSPERLKQFVAQRLAEGDYQRHLGLIHTIRSDLERLEDILKDVHPKEVDLTDAEPPVQRIVLFIDDLDRCPPARVVEVLEAVHLLLAFRLFVAVVGVDIRWVSQALRKRYPRQLGDTPGIASPTDYLEKVFQIPFWLPAMDATAGRRLLDAAVGRANISPTGTTSSAQEPTTQDARTPDAEARVPRPRGADSAGSTPVVIGFAPVIQPSAPPETDRGAVVEALVVGETERERLLDMAAAVGASPRRANRFANLYLLLKASLSTAERRGFVLDSGVAGSYEGALILLAAATGAPRATRGLIARLAEEPGEDIDVYLQTRFTLTAPSLIARERAAFEATQAMALAAKDRVALVRHLRHWAPRVTRFVFESQDDLSP